MILKILSFPWLARSWEQVDELKVVYSSKALNFAIHNGQAIDGVILGRTTTTLTSVLLASWPITAFDENKMKICQMERASGHKQIPTAQQCWMFRHPNVYTIAMQTTKQSWMKNHFDILSEHCKCHAWPDRLNHQADPTTGRQTKPSNRINRPKTTPKLENKHKDVCKIIHHST